jgi:hypothetical protein
MMVQVQLMYVIVGMRKYVLTVIVMEDVMSNHAAVHVISWDIMGRV